MRFGSRVRLAFQVRIAGGCSFMYVDAVAGVGSFALLHGFLN